MKKEKRARLYGISALLALALGIGTYTGLERAAASNEDAVTHTAEQGETLWDIARPIADERGEDIRELIYEIEINNNLGRNPVLTPGQKLVIR